MYERIRESFPLSAEEVAKLYDDPYACFEPTVLCGRCGKKIAVNKSHPLSKGLVGGMLYHIPEGIHHVCDEEEKFVVVDSSGYGNHGIMRTE